MTINLEAITIKIKFIEEKKLKAIMSINFGEFVVKGFRIQESKFENARGKLLWLTPPTYLGGGRHHPIFFMPDKERWKLLEEKIWDEYDKQSEQHYRKRFDLTDDIQL